MLRRPLAMLVLLTAGVPFAGWAEAQGVSIGVGAGAVDPQNLDTVPWFTANLRWTLHKNFVIEPEFGYWKKTQATPGTENTVKDLSAGVNILYRIPKKNASFFAGAGLGAHVVRSAFSIEGFDAQSDTQVKQGLHLLGGFDYKLTGGLSLFVAFRFDGIADLSQSKAYGGLRFKL